MHASDPAVSAHPRASLPRLAVLQFWRDLRAGELRLLLWAVVLAVGALSAVGLFADRMRAGMVRDAAQLMGGDVVLSSDHPLPDLFARQAVARGLETGRAATFPSMARAPAARGGAARLASVKAVDAAYPLRGTLGLQAGAQAPVARIAQAPAPGTVWLDPGLAGALGLTVGDPVELGERTLRVAGLVSLEPDRGTGFSAFAPRLMMNLADLDATGLVQPSSRISWRLALAAPLGREAAATAYADWAGATVRAGGLRGVRVETLSNGRPEMQQTLARGQQFLNLVALLTALLSAVAVAVAARDFSQRHLDACALLRVLGETQARIAWVHAVQFLVLGGLASVIGLALGWGLHLAFVALLAGWLPTGGLPPPGIWPGLLALGVGLTLTLGFGWPPVLQLARVPPLRVLRREIGTPRAASLGVWAGALLGFGGLLVATASDLRLGLYSVGGFAAAGLVFAGVGGVLVALLRRFTPAASAPRWLVLATHALAARPLFTVLQIASMAIGLMALWVLILLRTDLVDSWRASTPPDAPNRFVINLQPEQAAAFRATLAQAGVRDYDWYPMIRGRLLSINGASVGPRYADEPDARRLTEREFNLSHSTGLPRENAIVAGHWRPGERDGASVEEGLARTLGLHLGDELVFDIGGQRLASRVTSLRKVDWGSMRVNFFVLFPRADMGDLPLSYICAYRAPAQPGFDNRMAAAFPNITTIDVSATIAQVQGVLDQVVRAVELLFGFALVAGLVVLLATVAATREARTREFAIMRAVGASAGLLGRVQRAELAAVGAVAGLLAACAALGVGALLAHQVFEFSWSPPWWVPLAGAASGGALALMAGWWSLREVLARPVLETLRRATQE